MIALRVFFGGFLFLLIWTIGVHLVTFQALRFEMLYLVGAAAVLGAFLGAFRAEVIAAPFRTGALAVPGLTLGATDSGEGRARTFGLLGGGAAVFLVTAGLQYKFSWAAPFWGACLLAAGVALAESSRTDFRAALDVKPRNQAARLGALDPVFAVAALGILAFYFLTSIPDADDSLFLNFAVGAKELREAVYTQDTMLGLSGLDFIKSTYRLEGYQLLTALVSDLTGLSVVLVAHSVVPTFLCLWVASLLTLLHAALFPQGFAWTLAFHLLVLVALDGALRSFGYHAIPRFFQGKGPFVTAMVPLVAVLTLTVLRTGSWRALALLAGAVVISIGMTANAVYVAPLAAALIGLTWLLTGGAHRRRVFRLPLIVLYPLGLAVFLLVNDPPGASQHTGPGSIGSMLWGVFGSPPAVLFGLALLFAAILSPVLNRSFRPVSIYFTLTFLFVLNPLLWPLYAEHVTGNINYRLVWAIPVPLLVAVLLGFLWSSGRWPIKAGVVALLIAGVLGPGSVLRTVEFGFAPLKVPAPEFRIAQRVAESGLGDRLLLAPESVSAWITVLEGRPPVVEARWLYIPQREDPDFRDILDQRAALYVFWNRDPDLFETTESFLAAITSVGVRAVLLNMTKESHAEAEDMLVNAGFELAWRDGDFVLLTFPRD